MTALAKRKVAATVRTVGILGVFLKGKPTGSADELKVGYERMSMTPP